jgi:hypothetical protein
MYEVSFRPKRSEEEESASVFAVEVAVIFALAPAFLSFRSEAEESAVSLDRQHATRATDSRNTQHPIISAHH